MSDHEGPMNEAIYRQLVERGLSPTDVKNGLADAYIRMAMESGATIRPVSERVPLYGEQPVGFSADGKGTSVFRSTAFQAAFDWLQESEE